MADLSKNSVSYTSIGDDACGQRLDNYLLRICRGVPKSHVYRILRSGEVRVNKKRVDAAYRLQLGDMLRIPPVRIAERGPVEYARAMTRAVCPVVYEDEDLLVIDKPAGIAVHGGSGLSFGVIEALRQQRPEAKFLELAHRLDRETSGLLLVGKNRTALTVLHEMFRGGARQADKRYLVLVLGRWLPMQREVRLPLHKYLLDNGERRVRVAEAGKFAHTSFRLLARWPHCSLLEAQLNTGRTHQIRVHLAHLGYPIAGDDKYGDFTWNKQLQALSLKRMFLHAWKMGIPHPKRVERLFLEAPLPTDLSAFLCYLSGTGKQEYGPTF